MTMPPSFARWMTGQFIARLKPKRGDIFLTRSHTAINEQIRSWGRNPYGHAVLYLGPTPVQGWTMDERQFTFPRFYMKRCAFELPTRSDNVEKLLIEDKCFGVAHISPKRLTSKQSDELFRLCATYTGLAKRDGRTSTYSTVTTVTAGLVDSGVALLPDPFDAGARDGIITSPVRGLYKLAQAGSQALVEQVYGFPNLSCSAFCAWTYKSIGKPLTYFSTSTSPGDLYDAAKSSGDFTVTEIDFEDFVPRAGGRSGYGHS